MSVLEVKNLQKSFGNIRAVQDISFSVHGVKFLRSLDQMVLEKRPPLK